MQVKECIEQKEKKVERRIEGTNFYLEIEVFCSESEQEWLFRLSPWGRSEVYEYEHSGEFRRGFLDSFFKTRTLSKVINWLRKKGVGGDIESRLYWNIVDMEQALGKK